MKYLIIILLILLYGCSTITFQNMRYGVYGSGKCMTPVFPAWDSSFEKKNDKWIHKCVFLNYHDYKDSIFPSNNILTIPNLEGLIVRSVNNGYKKGVFSSTIPPGKLTIDSDRIDELDKLKILEFNWFDLNNFPKELTRLLNIKNLLLDCCFLDSIPCEIRKMKNLEVLSFRLDYISNIPSWLTELKRLKVIDLNNNNLTHIPKVLSECDSLQFIFLGNVEGHHEERYDKFKVSVNNINYLEEIVQLERLLAKENIIKVYIEVDNNYTKYEILDKLKENGLNKKIHIRVPLD